MFERNSRNAKNTRNASNSRETSNRKPSKNACPSLDANNRSDASNNGNASNSKDDSNSLPLTTAGTQATVEMKLITAVVSGRPTREVARSHMPVGVKGSPRYTSLAGGPVDMDPNKTYM